MKNSNNNDNASIINNDLGGSMKTLTCKECNVEFESMNKEDFCNHCRPNMISGEETMKPLVQDIIFEVDELYALIGRTTDISELNQINYAIFHSDKMSRIEKDILRDECREKRAFINDNTEVSDETARSMAAESILWMEEHKEELEVEIKPDLYIEVTPVYDDELNFLGTRFTPVDWQEEIVQQEQDLEELLNTYSDGERADLWTGCKRISVPIKSDEAEERATLPSSVNLQDPIDKYGLLEVTARAFSEGITCGTSFSDAGRNQQFECGANPNEVHDGELEIMGTFHGIKHAHAVEKRLAKDLAEITPFQEVMVLERARVEELLNTIMPEAKRLIKERLSECKSIEAAKNLIFLTTESKLNGDEPLLFSIMGKLIYDARLETADEEHMDFYTGTKVAKRRMSKAYIHDYKEVKVNKNTDVEILLKETKTKNGQLFAEVFAMAKEIVSEIFGEAPSKIAYNEVQAYLEKTVKLSGSTATGMLIKDGKSGIAKQTIITAIKHAQNSMTVDYFDRDSFKALIISGLVPKRPTFKGAKKATVVVTEETAKLIKEMCKGKMSGLTYENVAAVKEAAWGDRKKYGLPREVYIVMMQVFKDAEAKKAA